jgi:hypothetical protein
VIEGKLKVFSVGADWFYREMKKQDISLYKIDWSPPIEIPKDVSDILQRLKEK